MRVIGVGNCGMLLATSFNKNPILFSTAHQDTINFRKYNVHSFSEEGASKRFKAGQRIWEENLDELRESLEEVRNDKVIVFSSLGGGSGSSSISFISKVLKENNNKVLVVGIMPYKKEINPPLSNAVLSLNSIMPLLSDVSVMLFDNEKLKKRFEGNWKLINHYIVKVVDYLTSLLNKYSVDGYSPLTIDRSELESVIFGGGFIDFSETFLEEKTPKFEYGSLDKTTKNCLVVMLVHPDESDEEMDYFHKIFTGVLDKISTKVRNARMIPGILRSKFNRTNSEEGIEDRAYITIASGLNIERYIKKFSKLRDEAIKRATVFAEKEKGEKIVDRKESNILDL